MPVAKMVHVTGNRTDAQRDETIGPFQVLASKICYKPLRALATVGPRCLEVMRFQLRGLIVQDYSETISL